MSSEPGKSSTNVSRLWPILFLVFGLIGLADATFLTAQKLTNGPLPCGNAQACEIVTSSKYSTIGPVPISVLGVLYYLTVIIISLIIIDTGQEAWVKRLSIITWVGFLASLYLVYLMAFVIKAYCTWCLVSAGTSTLLWLTGLAVQFRRNRSDPFGPLPHIQ